MVNILEKKAEWLECRRSDCTEKIGKTSDGVEAGGVEPGGRQRGLLSAHLLGQLHCATPTVRPTLKQQLIDLLFR